MRRILQHRGLRLIFAANMISMLGSGLNGAAVMWYILQKTGSEVDLSYLVFFQTLPALLLLPFTGVFIDREDRRRIVMLLDAGRGLVILTVAILALRHQAELWHLYVMNTLVALGFWMFWPTITALIQELTPDSEFVHSNTFLMAGVQGGWLIAGAIVGFLYDHIGLGAILLIDVATYVISFALYLFVRKGRHVVAPPQAPDAPRHESDLARYLHELKEGFRYVRERPAVIALCTSWGLFLGAMLSQTILTAPLSERILHGGAVGYGWLNGGWGIGAFLSALYAARLIKRFGSRAVVGVCMAALTLGMAGSPFAGMVLIGVLFYLLMGSARGLLGIALSSTAMEIVPRHMMGRVQNTYYFGGVLLQIFLSLAVGFVAHHWSLTAAFFLIASVYGVAFALALVPVRATAPAVSASA
jgi:DHA3 family macrolide efflux protein-like MFS transporter